MKTRRKEIAAAARAQRAALAKPAVCVRLDRDVKKMLDEVAIQWGVPRGDIVARALDFYFKLSEQTPFGRVSKT